MFARRFLLTTTTSLLLLASSVTWAARPVDGDPEVGKKLFFERGCATCHSFDGTPKQGPTLMGLVGKTRPVITLEKPREIVADEVYIRRSILEPNHDILQGYVPGAMPGLPISEDEARHLTAGIVQMSGSVKLGDQARGNFVALLASTLVFVFGHLILSSIAVRRPFEKKVGAKAYQAIYSLFAIGAFVWMVFAYRAAPYIEVFRAPPWTRWIPLCVMPVAYFFFICSVSTRNPTSVGQEKFVEAEPQSILRITRHPMLWSFFLWGLAHISANGDIASLLLFAGISALAFLGMLHIDSRRRATLGEAWNSFAEKTPLVPFSKGNIGKAFREIGPSRILISLLLYGAFLHFHKVIIGVSPLP